MAKKKNRFYTYEVNYSRGIFSMRMYVLARTAQAAARRAFAYWIRTKKLKNQPATSCDGWFKGVTCRIR